MAGEALIGLLPPEPPPPPPVPWWHGLGLPAAAVLLMALLLAWWRRPATRRARQLRRLQRALTRPGSDTRSLAAQLETLLRETLRRPRLDPDAPPTGLAATDWHALVHALHRARFHRDGLTAADLAELLPGAMRIIRGGRG